MSKPMDETSNERRHREENDESKNHLSDVDRRGFMTATGAAALTSVIPGTVPAKETSSDSLNTKTRVTYWTEEMRNNARSNVASYDWARTRRDRAVDAAEAYLAEYDGLDDLWHTITSQEVPRSAYLSKNAGWNNRFLYSWEGMERDWKMTDGEYVFPTNDFESYLESGRDDRGMFDPERADDQYLVNEEHSEKPADWGVDDGTGWVDENGDIGVAGERYVFAAYYNHWAVWRPGGILDLMRALIDAYLLTGNQRYSRAGTVILDRIGDVYPEMTIAAYPDERAGGKYHNITGGRQTGRILGSHWEPNLVRDLLRSYDAFFPGQEGDTELVSFLDDKTSEYPGLSDKSSLEKIRKNIEDGFLREMLPAAKESQLAPGRGQLSTVCISARVLDEPDDYTRRALEWVYQPGEEIFTGDVWYEEPENWETTGGDVLSEIVDRTDRDGYFDESAPLYNEIRLSSVRKVANILQGYDGFDGSDLYQHPKFRRMLLQYADLVMSTGYVPEIGDTHVNRYYVNQISIRNGFKVYGDSIFAQLWYYQNGNSTAGIRGDIFSEDPERLQADIQAIIDAEGPLDLETVNLSGYGFTALRAGSDDATLDSGTEYKFASLPAKSSTALVSKKGGSYVQLQSTNGDGQSCTFEFQVPETGEYRVSLRTYTANNYGEYDIEIDGSRVTTYDFYAPNSTPRTEFNSVAERIELKSGTYTITFTNTGKNPESANYKMGLFQLRLQDADTGREREGTERATWLYYGRNDTEYGTSHTHKDTLNLGLVAHGLDLAPDLGYPEDTGGFPKRRYWTSNNISHNTVMVNEEQQHPQRASDPMHFDDTSLVKLFDAKAPDVYPQTDTYQRTTAMVQVDEEDSYIVDFFRIVGGDDHHYSFHSAKGSVTTGGVELTPQESGTYAGPTVPKPGYNEDTEYNKTVGNGFNYLDNVSRDADPAEKVTLDWDIEDHWGMRDDNADVHLRLTTFGDFDEVALADGHPPQREGNPERLRYALFHRTGTDLQTTFTSVIEPYTDSRYVKSVDEAPIQGEKTSRARAVKVELDNGRTDYVVTSTGNSVLTVDDTFQFKGVFGLYSEKNGKPTAAYINDGKLIKSKGDSDRPLISRPYGHLTGVVTDFTKDMTRDNEIEIEIENGIGELESAVGQFVYVENDDPANAAYPIEDVQILNNNRAVIDVGERTFAKAFANPDQLADGGYTYYLEKGDTVRIPLAESWSR